MSRRLSIALVFLLSLAGCSTDLNIDEQRFACSGDDDCRRGFLCVELDGQRQCVAIAELPDAGQPEASDRMEPDMGADSLPDTDPWECTTECTENELCCGDGCFDPLRSNEHCGACGNTCVSDQICVRGECLADTCAEMRLISVNPPPGTFLQPVSRQGIPVMTMDLEFSCDVDTATVESGVNAYGTVGGPVQPYVEVTGSTVSLEIPVIRGERISVDVLSALSSWQGDSASAEALEHYFISGAPASGLLAPPLPLIMAADGKSVVAMKSGDIDGNGQPDLVWLDDQSMVISLNQEGDFDEVAWMQPLVANLQPDLVDLGLLDLNGDGRLDIWLNTENFTRFLLSKGLDPDGKLQFVTEVDPALGDFLRIVATASGDLDLDGDMDMALSIALEPERGRTGIWWNAGDGTSNLEVVEEGEMLMGAVPGFVSVGAISSREDTGRNIRQRGVLWGGDTVGGMIFRAWSASSTSAEVLDVLDIPVEFESVELADVDLVGLNSPAAFGALDLPTLPQVALSPIGAGQLVELSDWRRSSLFASVNCMNEPNWRVITSPADLTGEGVLSVAMAGANDEIATVEAECTINHHEIFKWPDMAFVEIVEAIALDVVGDGALDLILATDQGIFVARGQETTP